MLRLLLRDSLNWLALLHTFAYYAFVPLLPGILLAIWLQDRQTALRLSLLLLVGLAWIAPYYLPRTRPAPDPQTALLDLISYNIWAPENPRLADDLDWLKAQAADVVVLVEIGDDDAKIQQIIQALSEVYPHYAMVDGSILIHARHPFVEQDSLFIQQPPPGRLVQRVVIDWQGEPVSIYGVHLSVPGPPPQPGESLYARAGFPFSFLLTYDESQRNHQIKQLLKRLADDPYPVIAAGDFNMSATSIAHDRLAAQLTDSFRVAGHGPGLTFPISQPRGVPSFVPPLLRLDYVWHDSGWQTVTAATLPRMGSDHLLLRVTLMRQP